MIDFKILKKSKKSRARLGLLKTSNGEVETPCLVPVATQAVVKTLNSQEAEKTKTQILIANTFHLHLKPGEEIVKKAGGLHKFMNWKKPLMTDSGGFQVFSLGFGQDLKIGKILKHFPARLAARSVAGGSVIIKKGKQPEFLKITQDGVYFRSPLDGRQLFLGPKESIRIQEKLGADIIFAFDECTAPLTGKEYAEKSLAITHRWEKICIRTKKSKQALFGIVQGSHFKNLREESAKFINSLGFDGFGIGGEFGKNKKKMAKILDWTIPYLDFSKPRHLLGIGYIEDMEIIIKAGIDLFDCTVPTHYARRGIAFANSRGPAHNVSQAKRSEAGRLDLGRPEFLKDKNPIDKSCSCFVCQNYKRNYISHLLRAKELTAFSLLTFHNLYFFNSFVEKIRAKIKNNKL